MDVIMDKRGSTRILRRGANILEERKKKIKK
jgi:hypothetical protein